MNEDAILLLHYAANRAEDAFATLVQRHLGLVYSAAMRRTGGDPHRAQDIVQFVFNQLAREAASVARHPTLSGWLHTATRNAALNAARTERRRRFYEQAASTTMIETSSPAAAEVDWAQLRPVLDDAVDSLRSSDRDAVVLRFLEGRPFADVGRALQISEDAARMRVDRALEKLRRLLVRRGVTSTAAALSVGLPGLTAMVVPGEMAAVVTGAALANAVPIGTAGAATFWAALTGTKMALGAVGTIVLVAVGLTAFGGGERHERAAPDPLPPAELASHPPAASPPPPAAASISAAPDHPILRQITPTPTPASASPPRTVVPAIEKGPSRLAVARLRSVLERDYSPLFDRLGLVPAQRDQLITLLVDERQVAIDFAAVGGASGVDVTADGVQFDVSVRQLREKIFDQIETLLGTDGFQEYQKTRTALQRQSWADGLEKKLRRTPDRLSADQSRQFAALLKESDLDPKGPAVIAAASEFLSPSQILAFRELQDERIAGSQKKEVQDAVRESAPSASPAAVK